MRLGVDFGTTRTVIAAAVQGRYPVAMFETAHGYSDFVPGLAASSGTNLELGWEAASRLAENPSGALRSIKRAASRVGPEEGFAELGEASRSALELVTAYLDRVRHMLIEHSNLEIGPNEPLETMVAVPANANTRQRYVTLEAFRRAGFQVLGMVNEPTAAAIEFAHRNLAVTHKRSPKRYVVVYDLGGGTFDTSAVSLEARRFELIASEGIGELGGDDFDQLIFEQALSVAGIPTRKLSHVEQARLLEMCREAKEALTPASRRMLIDLGQVLPDADAITLDLANVYDAARPLLERSLALLERVFERLEERGIDANNPRELGAIYLVGGATAFPLVGKMLRERYKRKVQLAPQPHAATAVGLAIAADPEAGIFVREAITRHFGVWREGDAGRDKVFDAILDKGVVTDSGDVTIERRYHPVHAVGHLRYLECSEIGGDGRPEGDLTPWGDIYFPYDPRFLGENRLSERSAERCHDLSEEILERYHYGRDGTVTVTIQNQTRGYQRSFVLGAPFELATG
ncbi:MAG TPA: Hsp70 family protein [Polyangiaceae bacterium]